MALFLMLEFVSVNEENKFYNNDLICKNGLKLQIKLLKFNLINKKVKKYKLNLSQNIQMFEKNNIIWYNLKKYVKRIKKVYYV